MPLSLELRNQHGDGCWKIQNQGPLGVGGFATVFKTRVIGLDIELAMKMIEPKERGYKGRLAALDREEKIYLLMKRLTKPSDRCIAPYFWGRYTCDEMQVLVIDMLEPAKFKDWSEFAEEMKYVNYPFGIYARIN